MNLRLIIGIIALLLIKTNQIVAQQLDLVEKDSVIISSLQKGKLFIGFGGNLNSDTYKNSDELVYYIHTEKEKNLQLKLKAGYFVDDRKAVGVRFDFDDTQLRILYSSLVEDSLVSIENNRGYTLGLFQKQYTPIFNSTRVYFITQPEISYSFDRNENVKLLGYEESLAGTSKIHTVNLGVHFGVAIFPVKGFSLEGKVGPLGAGYSWENFFENGKRDLNSENLFINLAPKIHLISFTFTSYF